MAFKVGPNLPSTVVQAGNQISVNAISALAAGDTPSSTNPFVTVSYFNSHGGGGGGGSASWGSISGTITNQTDLINKFNTYLLSSTADSTYLTISNASSTYFPKTGGTIIKDSPSVGLSVLSTDGNIVTAIYSGQVTLQDSSSLLSIYPEGIQFPDGSTQTTSAINFTGGSINSAIYWADGTVNTSFNNGYFLIQDSSSGAYGVLYQNGMEVGDGTNTLYVHGTGITFADSTTQSTAVDGSLYLLLSGGAMTGALQLGGDLACDGYNLSGGNFSSPAGQVNCQNITLTNDDSGSVTFSDGSIQTTAFTGGSSGLDAFGAFYAGICATLYGMLQSWNYYYSPMQFTLQNSGSGQPFSGPSFALTSGNIGITSDGVNFYPIDQYQSYGGNNYIASSTYSGSPYGVYLAFKDGSGTWHQCPINFA